MSISLHRWEGVRERESERGWEDERERETKEREREREREWKRMRKRKRERKNDSQTDAHRHTHSYTHTQIDRDIVRTLFLICYLWPSFLSCHVMSWHVLQPSYTLPAISMVCSTSHLLIYDYHPSSPNSSTSYLMLYHTKPFYLLKSRIILSRTILYRTI